MNSVCEDIKDKLVELGIGTFKTTLFIGTIPDEVSDCICLYDTTGGPAEQLLGDVVHWRPSFQVIVRNTSYEDAYATAQTICEALQGLANVTINSTKYIYVGLTNGPNLLTSSGSGNTITPDLNLFSINFDVKRTAG